ncbi:hypothetical protein [Trichococcus collinsii]|uniref:IrrE N-terminal-like domain-containing protein n=1 Tax=Trichococcus collinsii TaxID=157076 RepID=A0AB37ZXB7_9LACT|nr:hypothetical protein [Trichococcus collinsii]CZR02356.1 Hypothetical protein Tcol_2031 [Trichococcus collinsii]SDZ94735.1 hypothetical protein SAMN04488525_101695 [Trichococcus collinsii]
MFPRTIKIGGLLYGVEITKDLQGKEGNWGHIAYKETKIRIDDNLNPQLTNQTLIHEMTHGILMEAGYSEHEEEMADRIGKVLYQVLKDNDFIFIQEGATE